MTKCKTFTEFEKGIVAGHVNEGWGARRIAEKIIGKFQLYCTSLLGTGSAAM